MTALASLSARVSGDSSALCSTFHDSACKCWFRPGCMCVVVAAVCACVCVMGGGVGWGGERVYTVAWEWHEEMAERRSELA